MLVCQMLECKRRNFRVDRLLTDFAQKGEIYGMQNLKCKSYFTDFWLLLIKVKVSWVRPARISHDYGATSKGKTQMHYRLELLRAFFRALLVLSNF